ncbi:hypothetical protein BZG35_15320 [Brevundimonas sp. LM2]|uniref:hypothetical protein n=1 Tax=Brevundimonas sp. LM2 TaxID=1938605 RepID=UPI00098390A8|nr:hypothetical protein [Brevundimonas sp. LM2]AQR62871.1 hypothetical protein BZG35_15320 [Brevundimonas sp. LM2]
MIMIAVMLIQLAQQPLARVQGPAQLSDQQRLQIWTRWNASLYRQLSACAEAQEAFDPYDSANVDLWVTMRLAPDGQILGEPVVRAGGDDWVVTGEPSRPEIAAFFKTCAPYPPTVPSRPTLLRSDGSRVLNLRLPLRREGAANNSGD